MPKMKFKFGNKSDKPSFGPSSETAKEMVSKKKAKPFTKKK